MDFGGQKCVVGFDGVARAAPMDAEDLRQRQLDEARSVAEAEARATATIRRNAARRTLAAKLIALGLTEDEITELMGGGA